MYGKHRRTLCCSWLDFRPSAHYLLQVILLISPYLGFSQFDSSDHVNLQNCRRLLSALVNGDPDQVTVGSFNAFEMQSDIWNVLRYADFQDMGSNLQIIANRLDQLHSMEYSSHVQLQNIAAHTETTAQTITRISDKIEQGITVNITNDFIIALSNSIASIPLVRVEVTNFLNSSGNVDLSMVTNNTVLSQFFARWLFDHYDGDYYPQLMDFFRAYYDSDSVSRRMLVDMLSGSSSVGLPLALILSALPSSGSYASNNLFQRSFDFWFGDYVSDDEDISMFLGSPYTIFDAYNTLGLGVLTNQAASILSVAHANTNLLTQILSILDNSDFGLEAIATAVSTSSVSLGTSGQAELDHSVSYDLPQWEPTYSREVDANTNVFEFDDALGTMTRSMFGDTTNQTGSLSSGIGNIRPGGDLSLAFDFSGFNLSPAFQNFAPWSFSTSFAGFDEIKDFFKTLSRYMFYVLDLCLVIIGCRRIQHAIFGDAGIL